MINVLIVFGILFYALIGYGTAAVYDMGYKPDRTLLWLSWIFWPVAWVVFFIFMAIQISLEKHDDE